MQVACSRCRTRYKIPSEKLEAGPIKVRCKECDHIFGVRKKKSADDLGTSPEPVAAAAVPSEEAPPSVEQAASGDEAPEGEVSQTEEPSQGEAAPPSEQEGQEEELLSDAGFGDLDIGTADEPAADEPAPEEQSAAAANDLQEEEVAEGDSDAFVFGNLELDDAAVGDDDELPSDELASTELPASDEAEEQAPPDTVEFDLSDFDSSIFDDDADATISLESKDAEDKTEELFDKEPEPKVEVPSGQADDSPEDVVADLSELELSAFDSGSRQFEGFSDDEPDDEQGHFIGNEPETFSGSEPESFLAGGGPPPEELEQVEVEDIITHPLVEGLEREAQAKPRLDLRKGDRRSDNVAVPIGMPVKKKRTSVLMALLISVVMGTAAFVGYNALVQPDAAFYFFNPDSIMQWLEKVQGGDVLKLTEPVEGSYLDRAKNERLYVVSGWITNTSSTTRSAIEVKSVIFGSDGAKVAEATSFCGNVISQEELKVLKDAEITERLTRSEGSAKAKLDVAPGGKAPFMAVFFAPPPGVGKFTVEVTGSAEAAK